MCVVCRCRNECRTALRRHRRGGYRCPAMVLRAVVVFRPVQESRWTMVASGMGMCPCTLAGRRGDSGHWQARARQSSVLPATGIYWYDSAGARRGVRQTGGRIGRTDGWMGLTGRVFGWRVGPSDDREMRVTCLHFNIERYYINTCGVCTHFIVYRFYNFFFPLLLFDI